MSKKKSSESAAVAEVEALERKDGKPKRPRDPNLKYWIVVLSDSPKGYRVLKVSDTIGQARKIYPVICDLVDDSSADIRIFRARWVASVSPHVATRRGRTVQNVSHA